MIYRGYEIVKVDNKFVVKHGVNGQALSTHDNENAAMNEVDRLRRNAALTKRI